MAELTPIRKRPSRARRKLNIRIDDETLGLLDVLARRWKCKRSEVVRKAIHECASKD